MPPAAILVRLTDEEWSRLRHEVTRRKDAGERSVSIAAIVREAIALYWQQQLVEDLAKLGPPPVDSPSVEV